MSKMIINGEVYSGSTNYASAITYIKEDGTKSTVQKELDSRPVNNNILINSNFANPVNQRGITNLKVDNGRPYWIDRWKALSNNGNTEYNIVSDGIQINNLDEESHGTITQFIEFAEELYLGKPLIASVCIDGFVHTISVVASEQFYKQSPLIDGFNIGIGHDANVNAIYLEIYNRLVGNTRTIQWVKLELGEVATPYVPRLYAEELRLCKRYYQKIYIGVPITQISTDSLQTIVSIPCEEMSLDKPRIDATDLRISANGVGQGDIILSNCAIITSQCKFYIKFDKASHGLTVSNNLSVQGLLIMDAEL